MQIRAVIWEGGVAGCALYQRKLGFAFRAAPRLACGRRPLGRQAGDLRYAGLGLRSQKAKGKNGGAPSAVFFFVAGGPAN